MQGGETVVGMAGAATVMTNDDDRTQLVGRSADSDALASGPTRVLDPSLVTEGSSEDPPEVGRRPLPHTRVRVAEEARSASSVPTVEILFCNWMARSLPGFAFES